MTDRQTRGREGEIRVSRGRFGWNLKAGWADSAGEGWGGEIEEYRGYFC